MYSPIRRSTRKQGNTSAFDRKLSSSGARKIDNNKRRRNQRRRQTRSWCKKNKKNNNCIRRFKTTSKCWKLGRFLSQQIVANTELQNKQDLPTECQSLLFVQPTLWFCCQMNSKAPKVGQVFPYTTCNNHSLVVLFVDWSIMKLMLQFGKVQL